MINCGVCGVDQYMADPNYAHQETGELVLCCWNCRKYKQWKISSMGYIPIEEWIRQEQAEWRESETLIPAPPPDEPYEDDRITLPCAPPLGYMGLPTTLSGSSGTP